MTTDERVGSEFRPLRAVAPDVDAPGRSAIDVLDRLENRRLALRRVELAAGRFDRRLPDVVGQHAAERFVVAGADHVDGNFRLHGAHHDFLHRHAMDLDLRILAVREQHHQVAGCIEEVERLEQPGPLLDRGGDRRPLIGEFHELGPVADQRQAEQDVLVVGRERRHHVGFVAEFDEADEVVVLAVDALLDECLGRGDGGEERRFVRRLLVQVGCGEARHHARRGVDHHGDAASRERHVLAGDRRERIGQRHHEEGHAREEQQQRAVTNERGREEGRPAAPFEHRRQRHLRPPGFAPSQRAAGEDGDRQAGHDDERQNRDVAMEEQ